MAIDSIGNTTSQQAQAQAQQATLGQQDLFNIMLTQLTYQDPLKPLDNQQFIAQLAQFTNMEQNRTSNDKLDNLLTFQAANQSIGLIGKTVQVETNSGGQVATVTAITFKQGTPQLTVRTTQNEVLNDIRLSQISVVQ